MKNKGLIIIALLTANLTNAQSMLKTLTYGVDATIARGLVAPALSVTKNFSLKKGKSTRFSIGTGVRFTHVSGNAGLTYLTAPANPTSDASKVDSFHYGKTSVNALNLIIALNYRISRKLEAEFSIDGVGFSFGGSQNGTLQNPLFVGTITSPAKPTDVNLLLVGDRDKGTLNSQMVLRYKITPRIGVKAGAGFLFTEYTNDTDAIVNNPSALNARFRNKSMGAVVGAFVNFPKVENKKTIKKDI